MVTPMLVSGQDGEVEFISNAAELCRLVNDADRFTASLCLYAVSGDQTLAEKLTAIKTVELMVLARNEQEGSPNYDLSSDNAIKQRCLAVWKLSKKVPNLKKVKIEDVKLSNFHDRALADVMRLVGIGEDDAGKPGKLYKKIDRYIKSQKENPPPATVVVRQQHHEIPSEIDLFEGDESRARVSMESAISTLTTGTSEVATTKNSSSLLASKPQAASSSSRSDFVKLTTLPETRRTSNEKQTARKEEQAWNDIHSISYKIGSILYDGVQRGRCPLTKFSSIDKIVEAVNALFGCETISPGEIRRSYAANNIGKSPPRHGKATRVDAVSFSLLAQLVFTCQTIEQANCIPNRLNRTQLTAEVGAIVNAKLMSENQDELNEVQLFERIQKELARETVLTTTNPRELLRAQWLTYDNQNLNHINFERTVVSLGFGRWPRSDDERNEQGNVILFPGQARRILQLDEMGFSADGSKNGMGGRPSSLMTNSSAPDAGTPVNKSSAKTSWLLGVNFADEALPPMAVFATSAINPKFRGHYLRNMHQVEGIFGYPGTRSFPASFAASENGSVTNEIFFAYLHETIVRLYPDVADEPGKRVLLKVDSGPGRFFSDFRAVA
jgi:hypothetical protein